MLVSNCTGGIIYHELGMQFTNPFINMQMDSTEFIHFVLDLKNNMSKELEFFHSDQYSCPTAKIGDATLIFTHYKTEEETLQKWNERKERMNWDNLYIMTNDCGVSDDDVKAFEKLAYQNGVRNFAIFTAKEHPECQHALFLKDYENEKEVKWNFERSRWMGSRYFEQVFDYVGFLNSYKQPVVDFLKR